MLNPQVKDDSESDLKCQQGQNPTDSVSAFAFMPTNEQMVAASCWDGKVKVYQLSQQGLGLQMDINVNEPAMDLCWKQDGSMIFVAAGNCVKIINVSNQQVADLGKHDAGISNIFWNEQNQCLITTGFDCKINFWQITNNQGPVKTIQLQQKIYCSAVKDNYIICGLQTEKILLEEISYLIQNGQIRQTSIFDSSNLQNTSQINSIALGIKDQRYVYAVASIDGRANLSHFQLNQNGQGWKFDSIMTFKCHKEEKTGQQIMHPVNGIGFNVRNQSFVYTAGSEGKLYFWDIQQKNKIKTFNFNSQPITAACVSPSGQCIVYGLGYDWHAGYEKFSQYTQYKVCCHIITDNETKYSKN